MLNINTNLSGFIVQSSLKNSTNGLNQAIERMTTGYKINHAKDNAANYGINTKLSTKISAYSVAEKNAMMGLDMVSTASSSLDGISNLLSRLRSLSIQAQNGTYGNSSLSALNSEASALVSEISRIRTNTKYNGIELLAPKAQEPEVPYTYTPNADGFLIDVVKRDTSAMTTLASVDETVALTTGTYSISTAEELAKLATMTNKGLIGKDTEFVLANDIDLSAYSTGSGWTPIGDKYENSFEGDFDGNGYTIKNLYIGVGQSNYAGLFGYSGKTMTSIENLGVINAQVIADNNDYSTGIIAASTNTTDFKNCYATGQVSGSGRCVGGLVGYMLQDSIKDCYTDVDIKSSTSDRVGGLSGVCSRVYRSFAAGNIYAPNADSVAGLVGTGQYVGFSYALGDITGKNNVGGIMGHAPGTGEVENCYQTGNVSGERSVAGIVGAYAHEVKNCQVIGTINGSKNVSIIFNANNFGSALIENCSYYSAKNPGVRFAGVEYTGGNNIDLSKELAMTEKVLQIGINSTETSTLQFSTGFAFNGLDSILSQGLDNPAVLETIDDLIAKVNAKQTELGAVENRLMSALEQISVSYDNLVSTQSTIRDADIAKESSAYIRNQILQQASSTLLASSRNLKAENVLGLLSSIS